MQFSLLRNTLVTMAMWSKPYLRAKSDIVKFTQCATKKKNHCNKPTIYLSKWYLATFISSVFIKPQTLQQWFQCYCNHCRIFCCRFDLIWAMDRHLTFGWYHVLTELCDIISGILGNIDNFLQELEYWMCTEISGFFIFNFKDYNT